MARGASIQVAMLSELSTVKNMSLLDVTNLSFGVKVLWEKMSKIIKEVLLFHKNVLSFI